MDYAIGDIQGLYQPLMKLLDIISFNDANDRLWLVGDLVNRGPDSFKVLSFLKQLKTPPIITLGNHDLHLTACFYDPKLVHKSDTFHDVLKNKAAPQILHWLLQQKLCYFDKKLNVFMSHAGIPPIWSIQQALSLAAEVETLLQGCDHKQFLKHMYGNSPNMWDETLTGHSRHRVIVNYFTRMRWLSSDSRLLLDDKGNAPPKHGFHWFNLKRKEPINADIIFGHWAALNGITQKSQIHALDTGCIWGGPLTAICLQTKKRYTYKP